MIDFEDNIYYNYSYLSEKNNPVKERDYSKYGVKRGLRNSNGSGVLAGLTGISKVEGHETIDGIKVPSHGRLYYREKEIKDIIDEIEKNTRFGFEKATYLLMFGEFPSEKDTTSLREVMNSKVRLPKMLVDDIILKNPSEEIMNQLQKCILSLYSYDRRSEDTSIPNLIEQSLNLISKFYLLTIYNYQSKKHKFDKEELCIHSPSENLSIAENILYTLRKTQSYKKIESDTLDLILTLHAEHGGGNNSTFSTHVLSSSGTDTYSIIAAALGSLKGTKHGGANIKVYSMIEDIKKVCGNKPEKSKVKQYLRGVLKKEIFDKRGLIYGVGHAVYTLSDPRAVLLKKKARELSEELKCIEKYTLYETVEAAAIEVFKEEKGEEFNICTNVDFYSSLLYSMLDIPEELFTPLFATARLSGWCAHRIEQALTDRRIIRPVYKSIIKTKAYKKTHMNIV